MSADADNYARFCAGMDRLHELAGGEPVAESRYHDERTCDVCAAMWDVCVGAISYAPDRAS